MKNCILRNDIEYIIHTDSKGNIIGPISKSHAHLEGVRPVLTHYSSWAMVYHIKTRKYGIQLKNPKCHDKYAAKKWDMGVAGHNNYIKKYDKYVPLDFKETLIKEAKEEIGITLKMHHTKKEFIRAIKNKKVEPIGYIFEKFHYKTERNNEWVGLGIIIVQETKVKFEDDEVIDFKWLSAKELHEFLKKNNNYCSPLPLAFTKTEKFIKENSILIK